MLLFDEKAGATMMINAVDDSAGAVFTWPTGGEIPDDVIVTSVADNYKELHSTLNCFGEHSHTYAFGQDTVGIHITLLVSAAPCESGTTLKGIIDDYNSSRLYKAEGAEGSITYSGVVHKGHLTSLSVTGNDPIFNVYTVQLTLVDPPTQE